MNWALRTSSGPIELLDGSGFIDVNGIQQPSDVLVLWSHDDLSSIDVFPIVEPTIPAGQIIASSTLVDDGTTITRNATFIPQPPPQSVTNYQARAILIERGLFSKVDSTLKGADMTEINNQIAFNAWEYANEFLRQDPLIVSMQALLQLSNNDVDVMFIAADKIGV